MSLRPRGRRCRKQLTVGGEVGDAPDRVALDLDVRRQHLADEGLESAELDDRELVLACTAIQGSG